MILKVISINLWHGGKLFDQLLEFLIEQDADIVLMQEVYNGEDLMLAPQFRSMQSLNAKLNYPAAAFAPAFRDFDRTDGKAQRGEGIFSKFPLNIQTSTFFSESGYSETYRDVPGNFQHCPRELQHVIAETPVGDVHLFNLQGIWDMDGDNFSAARRKMGETIAQAVANKSRVILAGDTNARPTNKCWDLVHKHLRNAFGNTLITTFNMRRKDNPGYATSVVDMLLVSPDVEVLEKSCPDLDISDHRPLITTLKIQ